METKHVTGDLFDADGEQAGDQGEFERAGTPKKNKRRVHGGPGAKQRGVRVRYNVSSAHLAAGLSLLLVRRQRCRTFQLHNDMDMDTQQPH